MSGAGGPAFPVPEQRASDGTGIREGADGMSLRDYFAAAAMAALIQRAPDDVDWGQIPGNAFWFADQMLAARSAPE